MVRKRIVTALLFMFAVFEILHTTAFAIPTVDTAKEVTFTVDYKDGEKSLSAVRFDLYRVADITEFAEFTPTPAFAEHTVNFNELDTDDRRSLAATLSEYVLREQTEPNFSGETDENGALIFRGITPGLYLVTGKTTSQHGYSYTPAPFLIRLPSSAVGSENWNWSPVANVKFDRDEHGTTPDNTPQAPQQPSLPQTGVLWWPVPLLTAVGVTLTVIGLTKRKGTSNEK